jgi:hypothetical protein
MNLKRSPMPQRSKPMSRGKGLARGARLSPRNRTRSTAARKQDFGEEAATVRLLPCTVLGCCVSPCQPAHVKSRGAGGGRFDIVPLCHEHHREQHSVGIKTFAAKYALDLRAEADRIALAHSEPLGIRGLADRFVIRCACVHEWAARPDGCDCCAPKTEPLDDYERGALLGNVHRWLSRDVGHHGRDVAHDRDTGTCFLADKLGIGELACRDLIAAAGGWP